MSFDFDRWFILELLLIVCRKSTTFKVGEGKSNVMGQDSPGQRAGPKRR